MKIKIEYSEGKYGDERREVMEINGKYRQSVGPLCESPEDAIIGRDLVSCRDIAEYMKEAWEAGRRGEEFAFEVVREEEEE